jgi:hypothetical protein
MAGDDAGKKRMDRINRIKDKVEEHMDVTCCNPLALS